MMESTMSEAAPSSPTPLPDTISSGVGIVSSSSEVVLSKYKNVAKKLKAMLDEKTEEAKLTAARIAELELAARSAAHGSALSALLSGDAESARVLARAAIGGPPSTAPPMAYVCLGAADGTGSEWVCEEELTSRAPRFATAVRSCEPHVAPAEAAALRLRSSDLSEELRRYRVRAEALLRARDADLQAARDVADLAEIGRREAVAVAAAGGHGGGEGVLADLRRRLAEAQSQAERLLRARSELLERQRVASEMAEDAARETTLARQEASMWQSKWEEAVGAVPGSSGTAAPILSATTSVGGVDATTSSLIGVNKGDPSSIDVTKDSQSANASAATELELAKLSQEYTAYRKRAVALMREKDDQLQKSTQELTAARARTKAAQASLAAITASSAAAASVLSPASPSTITGGVGGGGGIINHHTPSSPNGSGSAPDAARWAYLRALLVKYMAAGNDDLAMRNSLEPALATVLGLGPAEVMQIARSKAGGGGGSNSGEAIEAALGGVGVPVGIANVAGGIMGGLIGGVSSLLVAVSGVGGGGGGGGSSASVASGSTNTNNQTGWGVQLTSS